MKKLLSLLLCITMLAVLVVPVMAATEPEETVWEEESDTIYFEMVTVDPECAVGHFPHPDHYAASLHLHGSDDRLSVDGV